MDGGVAGKFKVQSEGNSTTKVQSLLFVHTVKPRAVIDYGWLETCVCARAHVCVCVCQGGVA